MKTPLRPPLLGLWTILVFLHVTSIYAATGVSLPYDIRSTISLGQGINIDFPITALSPCLKYDAADIGWDTSGAVTTDATMSLVNTYEKLSETLNVDLTFSSHGKFGGKFDLGTLQVESNTTFNSKFEKFRSRESESLAIVFMASSSYGRRYIKDYDLKPEFKKLGDSDPGAFRQRCGTHIATHEVRHAQASIVIEISGLSTSSKDSLSRVYSQTVKVDGKIGEIGGEAGSTLSANYKNLVELAKKYGEIRVKYHATGGKGIQDAGQIIAAIKDPSDFTSILNALGGISKNFSKETSAPTDFLFISVSNWGIKTQEFDRNRFNKLNEIFLTLLKIQPAIERMEEIRKADAKIYSTYYEGTHNLYIRYRDSLIGFLNNCSNEFSCDQEIPKLDELFWLNDVVVEPRLTASCTYGEGKIHPAGLVEGISVNLRAKLRFIEYIDLAGITIEQLGPDFKAKDITGKTSNPRFQRSGMDVEGNVRMFGSVDYVALRKDKMERDYGRLSDNDLEDVVGKLRNTIGASLYALTIPGLGGESIAVNLGQPSMQDCPIKK